MRRMLCPFELHSLEFWKPAEELNLVPFRPALQRFGLEDRRRERGPQFGGDGEIRTHTYLFTRQSLYQLELHRH